MTQADLGAFTVVAGFVIFAGFIARDGFIGCLGLAVMAAGWVMCKDATPRGSA